METVKSEQYRGYTINIFPDEDPQSPREWDNLGIIAYKHRDYTLGEEEISDPDEWLNNTKGYVMLPLYLYDHSGITISTTPFSCPWDSGQVGYIYTTLEHLNKLGHNWKRWSNKRREQALEWLREEIKTFDQYITGDVYGYQILDPDGEEIGSCWGYFGYEHVDELIKECKSTVDCEIKDVLEKRFTKIKGYINGKVPIEYRELPELV